MTKYQCQYRLIRTLTTVYRIDVESDHPPSTEDIKHLHEPRVTLIQEIEDKEYRMDWTISERTEPGE